METAMYYRSYKGSPLDDSELDIQYTSTISWEIDIYNHCM